MNEVETRAERKSYKLIIETKKLEAIYQKKILSLEELKKSMLQKAFRGNCKKEMKHFAEKL